MYLYTHVLGYILRYSIKEHHSHSLELLYELSEPELSLCTCRAEGSRLLHVLFVLRVFLLPARLRGQEGHIVPEGMHEPTLPAGGSFTQLFCHF